jgi:hypothetical protein
MCSVFLFVIPEGNTLLHLLLPFWLSFPQGICFCSCSCLSCCHSRRESASALALGAFLPQVECLRFLGPKARFIPAWAEGLGNRQKRIQRAEGPIHKRPKQPLHLKEKCSNHSEQSVCSSSPSKARNLHSPVLALAFLAVIPSGICFCLSTPSQRKVDSNKENHVATFRGSYSHYALRLYRRLMSSFNQPDVDETNL